MNIVASSILSKSSNFVWEKCSVAMKYDVPLALTYDIVNVWISIIVTFPVKTGSIIYSRGSFHGFLRNMIYQSVENDLPRIGLPGSLCSFAACK